MDKKKYALTHAFLKLENKNSKLRRQVNYWRQQAEREKRKNDEMFEDFLREVRELTVDRVRAEALVLELKTKIELMSAHQPGILQRLRNYFNGS